MENSAAEPGLELRIRHDSGKAKLLKAMHHFNSLIRSYQMIIAAFCRIRFGTKSKV